MKTDQEIEQAMVFSDAAFTLLGGTQVVLDAWKRAKTTAAPVTLEINGRLLGGVFKATLTFDGKG